MYLGQINVNYHFQVIGIKDFTRSTSEGKERGEANVVSFEGTSGTMATCVLLRKGKQNFGQIIVEILSA